MLLNTSTSGVTESPFLPPFFHTLQITFIVPGFVRTEGEGPAPEIILYECLTDTSPRRDIPAPQVILLFIRDVIREAPRLIPAQVDSNFITVMFCRSFRHHIQQEHRIATPGMMRWLRDTLTQGKIGTALIGIKRPAGSTRHPLTHPGPSFRLQNMVKPQSLTLFRAKGSQTRMLRNGTPARYIRSYRDCR